MAALDLTYREKDFITYIQELTVVRHLPLKRIFDLLFSSMVIFFGLPVFIMIALLIRLSSRGSIIYQHKRIGRGGKPFYCYKFRTMYHDADHRLKKILAKNPKLKKEWDSTQKLKNDPRVTKIGALLRKSSLDELPQFFNVLAGDLSVVGPRAMIASEIEKFLGEKAQTILSIRPGITGLWQTSGRSDTCYYKRIALDEEYVKNHSFLKDLTLIFKTIPAMIFCKGAY